MSPAAPSIDAVPAEAPASAASAEPRWLSQDEQRTWRTFLEATTLLMDRLDREVQADSGMPMGYYEILVRLAEAPGRQLRMSELAMTSQSSRSRLSHAVARLEEAGWVRREACSTDRRGAFAIMTEAGFAALAAAAPGHVAGVRRHLVDLLTPAQLEALREISQVVLTPLSDGLPGGTSACPSQRI